MNSKERTVEPPIVIRAKPAASDDQQSANQKTKTQRPVAWEDDISITRWTPVRSKTFRRLPIFRVSRFRTDSTIR